MNDQSKVSLAQNVKEMRENLPALMDYAILQAKLYRARFDALKAVGFTDAQALELCWRNA